MPSLRVLAVVLLVGMGAGVAALGGATESGEPDITVRGSLITSDPTATATPAASPAENQRAGTKNWKINAARGTAAGLAGYAGALSVLPGQPVPLSVDGDGSVRIRALRIGWYDGVGARQVWEGTLQAQREVADPRKWQARGWADTTGWPAGHYLIRLDQGDASRYLPLTVRSADNRGRIVVLTSPLTWQAENSTKPAAGSTTRALPKISFDRPYAAGYGAAGFLQNDAPIVRLAERSGHEIGYLTDADVATDPSLLDGAAAVLVGGDSQFWTASLRAAVRDAGDAGTNLAFFGAGTGSRQIRLVNDNRALQISRAKPSTSVRLTGLQPSCSVTSSAPSISGWVVGNAGWWGYRGTKLRTDDVLPGLIAGRLDRASTGSAGSPSPMQVLSYAQVKCATKPGTAAQEATAQGAAGQGAFSQRAAAQSTVVQSGVYLVRPSGAGVFTAGTGRWACAITGTCLDRATPALKPTKLDPVTKRAVIRITENIIEAFAEPRAGKRFSATNSASQYAALR